MIRVKLSPDWVQFGLFLVAVITLISAGVSYGINSVATKKDIADVNNRVTAVNLRVDEFKFVPTDIAVIKVEMQQMNKKLDRL